MDTHNNQQPKELREDHQERKTSNPFFLFFLFQWMDGRMKRRWRGGYEGGDPKPKTLNRP